MNAIISGSNNSGTVAQLDMDDVRILRLLRYEPAGRGELAVRTAWSRNTVAARLTRLSELGWIIEQDDTKGERGRPYVRYGLDPSARLIFTARIDADGISGAICRLDGEVIVSESHAVVPRGPDIAIKELDGMLERLAAHPNVDKDRIGAMVVGVPGPVSGGTRTVPWSKVGVLPSDLAAHFGMPVAIENDANIMALGARLDHPEAESLMFLLVETGIGAGLVLSGRLHRGLFGWAGEVGHIPVAAAGDTPCTCGNRGCLASVASNPALMRTISTPERPVETVDDLRRLILAGDPAAVMALRQAGRHIGEAIVGLVVGVAPDLIAVGGQIAQLGDHVIAGIRESISHRTPPALSSQIRVVANNDHYRTAIRGATEVGFDLLIGTP